eukprot:g29604.t1
MGNKEMAEELKRYFASDYIVEDTSSIPEFWGSLGTDVSIVAVSKEKILKKLKGQKVDILPRMFELHPRVLKEIAEEIVAALVLIFQNSLESGTVPEDWKMAN